MIIAGTMFSSLTGIASEQEQKAFDARLTPHKAELPKSEQEYNDYKSALLELFNAAKKLGINSDEISIDEINNDDIDTLRDILRDGRERKEKSNELYAEHARRKV